MIIGVQGRGVELGLGGVVDIGSHSIVLVTVLSSVRQAEVSFFEPTHLVVLEPDINLGLWLRVKLWCVGYGVLVLNVWNVVGVVDVFEKRGIVDEL